MAKQTINVGSGEYAGDGESLRSALVKTNENFDEVYTNIDIINTAGYITIDSVPTNVGDFNNDVGYLTTETLPAYPTVPTNVGDFNNDVGYLTTDTLPATPTDRLTAGTTATLVLLDDGTLKLTHPTEWWSGAYSLEIQKDAGNYHTFKSSYGLSLQATPVPNGYGLNTNTNFVDIFHDGVSVNVNDNTWGFGTDGSLAFPTAGAEWPITEYYVPTLIGKDQISFATYNAENSTSSYAVSTQDNKSWEVFAEDDVVGYGSGWAYLRVELPTIDTPQVNIETRKGIDGVDYTWTFDADGKLTTPGHIIPNADLAYDLGSTSSQWRNLYVGTGLVFVANTLTDIGITFADGSRLTSSNGIGRTSIGDTYVSGAFQQLTIADDEGTLITIAGGNSLFRLPQLTADMLGAEFEFYFSDVAGQVYIQSYYTGVRETTDVFRGSIYVGVDNATTGKLHTATATTSTACVLFLGQHHAKEGSYIKVKAIAFDTVGTWMFQGMCVGDTGQTPNSSDHPFQDYN